MSPICFVWVPGAWHGPEAFQETAAILKSEYGFESGFLHLASVGTAQPLDDPYADVPIIQKAIDAEVEKGRDVILVVHSYGGVPGCNALKGKLKKDAKGGNGVIGIAFQCSFALPQGVSLLQAVGGKDPDWYIREAGGLVSPGRSEEIFYNDCTEEQQEKFKGLLKPISPNVFEEQVIQYEAYKEVSSSYLICTLDAAIPAAAQEAMATQAGIPHIERLEASHSPFLSKPKELAAFLKRAADKAQAA